VPALTAPPPHPQDRAGPLFWALTLLLVGYVALCTPLRDSVLEADAWEHHRAIVALAHDLRNPGNPTYATDDLSIRYSPVSVSLAALSRATSIDPWTLQSAEAVLNTLLLCLGVRALLRALGRPDAAGLSLLAMVSLYGGAPGYANSTALADLPWHQVNPSAFAFVIVLFAWALFLNLTTDRAAKIGWFALALMLGVAMLEHAMTGVLGFLGLGLFSLFAGTPGAATSLKRLSLVAAVASGATGVCLAWPWYSFARAVLSRPDNDYWFNPGILRIMLTQWCAPGVVLSAWALTARDRRTILPLLACGFAVLGLVFFHLAIGVAAADLQILSVRAWRERLVQLFVPSPLTASAAFTLAACVTTIYFLAPQLAAIVREPHLARAYIAPLLHREDKQPHLRETYRALLANVPQRDVVLAEPATAWPIPSFGPRIVAAAHYEFFVPNQRQREADVKRFFQTTDESERLAILTRYNARWLLLDESRLTDRQKADLERPNSIVSRAGPLILTDVARWRQR
jgi:hypothetical protein